MRVVVCSVAYAATQTKGRRPRANLQAEGAQVLEHSRDTQYLRAQLCKQLCGGQSDTTTAANNDDALAGKIKTSADCHFPGTLGCLGLLLSSAKL